MASIFPDGLDTDLEIPRVDKGVTEISGDAINSIRDAIFAIQGAIGVKPQGNKPSLTDRVNVSIDANGNIKREALKNIGLVTLPITDEQVGQTAGIKESKLELDFKTSLLRSLIESIRLDLEGAAAGVSSFTAQFNAHILGTGNFHDGYQIKINLPNTTQFGLAGLEATTVGDALNEINKLLFAGDETTTPHVDLGLPSNVKHAASEISVNATNFISIDRASTNVQEALDSIDEESGALGVAHVDNFHANGILKEINSGSEFNPNKELLPLTSGVVYDEGSSVIRIPGVASFSDLRVKAGDILQIVNQSGIQDVGTYQIRATGPLETGSKLGNFPELLSNELSIFHTFKESRSSGDNVSVRIFRPASTSSELAPLACSVRNNETIVDSVSILNPNSARVVSLGLNGSILNSDGYEIGLRVGVGPNQFRDLVIPGLNLSRLETDQAIPVTSKTIAERINAYVSSPNLGFNYPVSAFAIGNELAIAHNLVGENYTLEVVDGYTGNFALGLDAYGANVAGRAISGNDNNIYSVNGVANTSLRTVFDGYASIENDTSTFMLWTNDGQAINPLRYGIGAGSVMHVTGHPTLNTNGSYTLFSSNSSSVSLFSAEQINAPSSPTTFNVSFYDSQISLALLESPEIDQGVVELYVDDTSRVLVHERLLYSGNLGSAIDLVNISTNFPTGEYVLSVGLDGDFVVFDILEGAFSGETVRIHESFKGSFKLYHPNNLDYVVVRIREGNIPGGVEAFSVSERLNLDESLKLCSVHFNGELEIDNIIDERLFGNLSVNEIREDFIEIFSQRVTQETRSDGVVRGFDILDIPFFDSITGMQALPLRGGIAYVNGVRVAVETQKVVLQSQDSEGLVFGSTKRIVGINEFGSITTFSDDLAEFLEDGYSADFAFGKILPLYSIDVVNGSISTVTDLRLFTNNIDSKLDLIVDETNNVVGNFRSLEGALLYADKYPGKEKLTIRIINSVKPSVPIRVPDGVSIVGGSAFGGNRHQIINESESLSDNFITLSGNNEIKDIEIISESPNIQNSLLVINGPNVLIEQCSFRFEGLISSNGEDHAIELTSNALENVQIRNNKINNVFNGILAPEGCNRLQIENNLFENISGTGGVSSAISLGTNTVSPTFVNIQNNTITVPSIVTPSDIRGINIDFSQPINTLRIENNTILHEAQNTMTNGIRIESTNTNNKINNLFISNNEINGIKLDDNDVWGVYIDNVELANVHDNIIKNVGVDGANNIDNSVIRIAEDVDRVSIQNNYIEDCDVLVGIELINGTNNFTERSVISGNTLRNLGSSATYILSNVPYSNISNNILVGPGKQGIRLNTGATYNKIIGNNFNELNTDSGVYSFEEFGIYVLGNDIDIENNFISGLDFGASKAFGISTGTASERVKILGNTIEGNDLGGGIRVYSTQHVVSNNRIRNVAGGNCIFISLSDASDSMVSGNLIQGIGRNAVTTRESFTSGLSTLTGSTIINNQIETFSLATDVFELEGSGVSNNFIGNNKLPSTGASSIGVAPNTGTTNTNVIGFNVNLNDTLTLPSASGVTGYDSGAGTGTLEHPHWVHNDTNRYWEVNNTSASDIRRLYFPITNIPSGGKIESVTIIGQNSGGGTMGATLLSRDIRFAGLSVTTIASIGSLPTGEFGIQSGSNSIDAGSTVVDYQQNMYFVEVSHSGTVTDGTSIRIYGVVIGFKY